jgi:putative membrane protein
MAIRPNMETSMLIKRSEVHGDRVTPPGAQEHKPRSKTDGRAFLKLSGTASSSVGIAFTLLLFSTGVDHAKAQNTDVSTTTAASAKLSPVDYNFVAQANLGAPFQIDSGRIAEKKAPTAAIRDYAHLMVVTHIPVVDALNRILQHKDIKAPPNTLLHGAYSAMIASFEAEHGVELDRDYVEGQVEYQNGNAALFQNEIENGSDPDLKEFARATLPKIEDHLGRALKLAKDNKLGRTASE